MTIPEWSSIVTSVIAVIVAVLSLYWTRTDKRESKSELLEDEVEKEIREQLRRLEKHEKECNRANAELATKVEVISSRVETIWNVMMKRLADILISPHTPELDVLLAKFRDNKLKVAEKPLLIRLLKEQVEKDKKDNKQLAFIETLILVRLESGH